MGFGVGGWGFGANCVPEEDTRFESNKYYCSYSESPFGLLVGFCSLQGRHANDLEIMSQARVIGKLTTAYKSCVGIRAFVTQDAVVGRIQTVVARWKPS